MMNRLKLHLLGPMSVILRDDERVDLAYDKVRALFAYLAVEHDRDHPRGRLAALLWPDSGESAARHSLSQALSTLRQTILDRDDERPVLISRQDHLRFDADSSCWVDLLEFNRLLAEWETHVHQDAVSCPQCLWRLERAVGLYRGPFLEGLSLPDSEEFEDWLRSIQQSAERSLERALEALVSGLEASGEVDRAYRFAERLLALDPWDERAHRTMMRLLAAGGRRADAIRQYGTCREILGRDLGLEPEPETEQLVERIRSGLEGPTHFEPQHRRQPPPAPALPEVSTPFIGRDHEVEQLGQLIEERDCRLITLSGPGGIGKTRLALEVARTWKSAFSDGAYFVSLAGLASPQLLASTILDAMFAQVDPQADPREQLLAYLQPRQILLVLDNFEHLLSNSLLLAEILEVAPQVQLLVTSRERLSLSGEWVYEVHGLSLPPNADATSVATSGAARLFMSCGRRHKANFLPRQEDAPAIVRVCRLTGGMPLALELAAAWVPVISPDEIADEIEQSLDFLSTRMRDMPERHQSVRAVLDRSWENLTEAEQRAFRRLSVFRGGFTRAAAGYVTGTSLPVLSALVSKSLFHRRPDGRYEIHELLRQYGDTRLLEDEREAAVVRDRHRDYFIGFLSIRQQQLEGKAQVSVLGEITDDIENVRTAWRRSIETRDFEGLSRAAHSLWLYYEITGRYREGASQMEDAYQVIQAIQDLPPEQHAAHQRALSRLGARHAAIAFRLSGPKVFRDEMHRAIALARAHDGPAEIGLQLNYLATAAHILGEWEDEERYLIESIEHFELAGHRWGVAYSMNDLGLLRALRGEYSQARELHQTALGILEEYGDQRGVAFALRNLGLVANQTDDRDLALALLRRSVDVRRPIGNQWGIAESLNQIGVLLRDSGQPDAAAEHFREALHIAREIRAMQLASEILKEYLPMLSEDIVGAGTHEWVDRLLQGSGATAGATAADAAVPGEDLPYLSSLVDTVLDSTHAGSPGDIGR